MAYEYLKALVLTEEEEQKVRALGARTPASLLSMLEHAPEKFKAFLGEETTERGHQVLKELVPEEEKVKLASLPPFRGQFGAVVVPPEAQSQPAAADAKSRRDKLVKQIQFLRNSGDSSPETQRTIANLESELRDAIKSMAAGWQDQRVQ